MFTISRSHKSSILPTARTVRPLPQNTSLYLPFNEHPYDVTRNIQPMPGAVYTMRPGEGRFGGAIAIEEGTTNLLSTQRAKFEGWTKYQGADVEVTQGQVFREIGRYDATRIKASGGTSQIKYILSLGASEDGVNYSGIMYVKNIGDKNLVINSQRVGINEVIPPGGWRVCKGSSIGNGTTQIQLRFYTEDVNDSVDAIAWGAQVEKMKFPTSFTDGSRSNSPLIYPITLPIEEFTISFWINQFWGTDEIPDGNRHLIGRDNVPNSFMIRRYGNMNVPRLYTFDGEGSRGYIDLDWPINETKNKWTHIALRKKGRSWDFFRNGELKNSRTMQVEFVTNPDLPEIGHNIPWSCLLSELLIVRYASSDDEIASWYNSGSPFYDGQDGFSVAT